MPYTFRVIFSGLCMYHIPDVNDGTRNRDRNFDPAVLLVNATRSKLSIDGKTHLHRHVPTLTFDPGLLDDFNVRTDSLETDFTLIPRLGMKPGKQLGRDHSAVVDLAGRQLFVRPHPDDLGAKPFRFQRELGSHPRKPGVAADDQEENRAPRGTRTRVGGNGRRNGHRDPVDEKDLCWLPLLEQIDRRVIGFKRGCFDDLHGNRLVTSRLRLDGGVLKTERFSEVAVRRDRRLQRCKKRLERLEGVYAGLLAGKDEGLKKARRLLCEEILREERRCRKLQCGHLYRRRQNDSEDPPPDPEMWEFVPNRFPGRTVPYDTTPSGATPDSDPGLKCYFPVRQAIADRLVLEYEGLSHPITLGWEDHPDRPGGFLTFPRDLEDTDVVEVHIANLPVIPDLPDTDVITHFRWFYECVDWKSGVPTDLPAPRLAIRGLRPAGGSGTLCGGTGSC